MMERRDSSICFHINGKEYKVPPTFSATTSLNDYLRNEAGLKGTKVMCREAGCGCCSVSVTYKPPDKGVLETKSVQSCMTPLYMVDGWQVTTIEGLGNQRDGFHPVQKRIAEFSGTQCGYCTPGMVMNMYGLLHQQPNITTQEIEDNIDGNICRCTGYRPILDAMKSFSTDGNIPGAKPIDIEDLNKHLCPKTGEACNHACNGGSTKLDIALEDSKWIRPTSLDELGAAVRDNKSEKIRLVFGNTGSGIYKNEGPFDVYIDLHQVKDLYSFQLGSDGARFGSATTLTELMNKLKGNQDKPGFEYFAHVVKHLKCTANVMVRNAGCIAGNLMLKHAHPEFPSDLYTMFSALGATVEVYDVATSKLSPHSMLAFLREVDMTGKVITAVQLPKLSNDTVYRTFKITPRWQNAHAYVNAAFKFVATNGQIKGKPAIVFGGINKDFVHAEKTEAFLEDKKLSQDVVKGALNLLEGELKPDSGALLASPEYRKGVAVSLLYKILLSLSAPQDCKLQSGPEKLQRPISTGLQTYQDIKTEGPLKEALPKKTAPLQASGEAQFVNDIPRFQQELFGAFVLSDQAPATLESVDATVAEGMPGVVKVLTAKDIPGENNYLMANNGILPFAAQELFASKSVLYAGQPVAMVLAEDPNQAAAAVKAVKINLTDVKKPILTIEESIAQEREFPFPGNKTVVGTPDDAWSRVDKTVEGETKQGCQYHFFLETQVSLAVPSEDGIDVYAATQFARQNQNVAAAVIGQPLNFINMVVPRIGGGFGGKAWDSCPMTAAASLGAYLTGKPVRVVCDMSATTRITGKRPPILAKYKAGFSNSGDVEVVEIDLYQDCGHTPNAVGIGAHTVKYIDMCYQIPNWKVTLHPMFTNKQSMSPVRAPGSVPASLVIEGIMEHVANVVGKHPIMIKELNLYERQHVNFHGMEVTDCNVREMWQRLKDTAEVQGRLRQVDAFNKDNLWKKRGITMTTSKYGVSWGGPFQAQVSINAIDGSVVVLQDGVEMGQGLYMKVAQGVAHVLGIPLDSVKVKPNQNHVTPNSFISGGSTTSERAAQAAMGASQMLKERMQPIREKFPDLKWKELCNKCMENDVDMAARYYNKAVPPKAGQFTYFIYCVGAAETEVDILTGESQVRRVDIMCDFGESLNPTVDIGQVEGAYVMGLGCFLTEDTVFDEATGRVLNDGTWNYKPPTTKDIPIDWRIHLLPDSPYLPGIKSSRATGEPPICLAVGALYANKLAVNAARKDLYEKDDFLPPVAPLTVERVQQSVGLSVDKLVI